MAGPCTAGNPLYYQAASIGQCGDRRMILEAPPGALGGHHRRAYDGAELGQFLVQCLNTRFYTSRSCTSSRSASAPLLGSHVILTPPDELECSSIFSSATSSIIIGPVSCVQAINSSIEYQPAW